MKPPEIIYVVNRTLQLVGAVERKFAHEAGLCHLTVLLLAARREDEKIAVQVRSPKKRTFPNALDIFGGHCAVGAEVASAFIGNSATLETIVAETAIREATEELRLVDSTGCPIVVTADQLHLLGVIGEFEMDSVANREKSSLFALGIPAGATLHPMDEQDGQHEPVRHEFLSLEELLAIHRAGQRQIADGLDRVLRRASASDEFTHSLSEFISHVASIV